MAADTTAVAIADDHASTAIAQRLRGFAVW
jgi:hypothetical protein